MLKELLAKTELNDKDTLKSAFLKGLAEGALDYLVLVGATVTLAAILKDKK